MDALLYQFGSFALVGALWGCTNPLLKEGSSDSVDEAARAGEKNTEQRGFLARQLHILLGVLTNWRFVVPFALNQSGSAVYVYLLGSSDISLAVPICNSLTFVFTAITSWLLGEKLNDPLKTFAGVFLVLVGVTICVAGNVMCGDDAILLSSCDWTEHDK
jgi:drug/metabolite transporter (DMT)-like permease